jgi:hypothetical protein
VDKRTPNDLSAAVPKFCLTVEEFRRTAEGRVRTPQEFLQHFFPHDANKVTDRLFKFLPNEVRGPVLTSWGLRGAKSALKDTDDKVQSVVWDALLAGDIDQDAFEQAILSDVVVRWVPLADWWTFWRGGKLSKLAIHKALDSAYELGLFDAKWFFDTIEGPGGKLKGTDVVSEGLTKAELTEWVRKIHASGDGSPKGMLSAIGWDRIVGKTPNDVLIKVLDSFAQKVALVAATPAATKEEVSSDERPSTRITPVPPASPAEIAEATITNATVGAGAGAVNAPARPRVGPPTPSTFPTSGELDELFSESKIPPAQAAEEHEQIVVVEEDIDMNPGSSDESTTNRPPASEEPVLLKPRMPTMPGTPAPSIPIPAQGSRASSPSIPSPASPPSVSVPSAPSAARRR